jgi:hypothetical protein
MIVTLLMQMQAILIHSDPESAVFLGWSPDTYLHITVSRQLVRHDMPQILTTLWVYCAHHCAMEDKHSSGIVQLCPQWCST